MPTTLRRTLTLSLLLAFLAAAPAGCGEGGPNEEVYLHVFNGYPGSSDMSLFGPSGTVASGLSFGQRTPNYVPVNRNLGTDYTLVVNGAPKPFELDIPLYNLYPQESATLFFKRRTGTDTFGDPIIYRHIQTGFSSQDGVCRLIFDNALSVKNDALGQFNYTPIFKINPACTGYVETIGTYSEMDSTVTTQSGNTLQVGRPNLLNKIRSPDSPGNANGPWFAPAQANPGDVMDIQDTRRCRAFDQEIFGTDSTTGRGQRVAGPKTFRMVWVGRKWQQNAEIDFQSGTARAAMPTRDYMNCIGWDPDKPPSKQKIKSEQVARCKRGAAILQPVKLSNEVTKLQFPPGLGTLDDNKDEVPANQCGFETLVASDFFNEFIEKSGGDEYVSDVVTFNPSQYYFWVLYGRPVDPLFEKWGANTPAEGGGFVEIPPYPGNPEESAGGGDNSGGGGGDNSGGGDNGGGDNGGGDNGGGDNGDGMDDGGQ